jgi:hypothetical protein
MNMKKINIAAAILFSCCHGVLAQSTVEIKNTDAYVRSLSALRRKSPDLIFADVADYDAKRGKWQTFPSEKALEKHREKSETYSIAYVWKKAGKVAATNFTIFSPSGDWTRYVYSYYRPDGTLSRADIDYRTFYGDLMVLQKYYFDPAGKVIKKTTSVLDLMTKKPKKRGTEFSSQAELMTGEFYTRTSKLPFASMIK